MKKLKDLKDLQGVKVLTEKELQTLNGSGNGEGTCFNGKYWYKCTTEQPL